MAENVETLAPPCAKPSMRNLSQEHDQTLTMKSLIIMTNTVTNFYKQFLQLCTLSHKITSH